MMLKKKLIKHLDKDIAYFKTKVPEGKISFKNYIKCFNDRGFKLEMRDTFSSSLEKPNTKLGFRHMQNGSFRGILITVDKDDNVIC